MNNPRDAFLQSLQPRSPWTPPSSPLRCSRKTGWGQSESPGPGLAADWAAAVCTFFCPACSFQARRVPRQDSWEKPGHQAGKPVTSFPISIRSGEAASVCLWFIFREWVVDNYPHNNETPLTIKLQIHTAPSWDGGICGAGLLLGWGTLLCVRCAKTNLDNSRLALGTHPTNTAQSEHPKTGPVRWGGVGPHSNPHQIKLSFKACWAPTMPKILEVCSVISNEWLCR